MEVSEHQSDCKFKIYRGKVYKECPNPTNIFDTFSITEANIYKHVFSAYPDIPGVLKCYGVNFKKNNMEIILQKMDPYKTLYEFCGELIGTEDEMKSVIFQVIYTLYCFEKIGLTHNDLHVGNIFYEKVETPYNASYVLPDNTIISVPIKFKTYIYDFDRSTIEFKGVEPNIDLDYSDLCSREDAKSCIFPPSTAFDLYRFIFILYLGFEKDYISIQKDLLKIISLNLIVENYLKVKDKDDVILLNVNCDMTAEKAVMILSEWFKPGKNDIVYTAPEKREKVLIKAQFNDFNFTKPGNEKAPKKDYYTFLYIPDINKNLQIIKKEFPKLDEFAVRIYLSLMIRKLTHSQQMILIHPYMKKIQEVEAVLKGRSFEFMVYKDMI